MTTPIKRSRQEVLDELNSNIDEMVRIKDIADPTIAEVEKCQKLAKRNIELTNLMIDGQDKPEITGVAE